MSDTAPASTARCPKTHNPGVWPYVARCVRDDAHDVHRDAKGREWTTSAPATSVCAHCGLTIERDAEGAPAWLDADNTSYFCPGTGGFDTTPEGRWHEPADAPATPGVGSPYFHTACGHRHTTAEDAAACPRRGWSQVDRAPYRVIRVTFRLSGITKTEICPEPS